MGSLTHGLSSLKPIRYTWFYLACRIGHTTPHHGLLDRWLLLRGQHSRAVLAQEHNNALCNKCTVLFFFWGGGTKEADTDTDRKTDRWMDGRTGRWKAGQTDRDRQTGMRAD
jgi:hypothetical protein